MKYVIMDTKEGIQQFESFDEKKLIEAWDKLNQKKSKYEIFAVYPDYKNYSVNTVKYIIVTDYTDSAKGIRKCVPLTN